MMSKDSYERLMRELAAANVTLRLGPSSAECEAWAEHLLRFAAVVRKNIHACAPHTEVTMLTNIAQRIEESARELLGCVEERKRPL